MLGTGNLHVFEKDDTVGLTVPEELAKLVIVHTDKSA